MLILRYEFVNDFFEKRTAHRQSHLDYLNGLVDERIIVAGGVLMEATPSGMIVLDTNDISLAHKIALNDPYRVNKLISEFHVIEWKVVVGGYLSKQS